MISMKILILMQRRTAIRYYRQRYYMPGCQSKNSYGVQTFQSVIEIGSICDGIIKTPRALQKTQFQR